MLSQLLLLSVIVTTVRVQCANEAIRARAYIYEAVKGGIPTKVLGTIDFEQNGTFLKLNGSISGLQPGPHGFHIHDKGDIGNGCLATAGHFNPHKLSHGAPDDSNRHVGDLGNINTPKSGDTVIAISDSLASLTGQHSILGRAVVVHEKADDLGRGSSENSRTTGDAGGRVACGVIGVLDEIEVTPTTPGLADLVRQEEPNNQAMQFVNIIICFTILVYTLRWQE